MRVLIIEDEYLLAEELEDKLMSLDNNIKVLDKLDSVHDSVEWLKSNTCDLIFLDIHLSDGISFSIFDEVETQIPIIFTTAYDQYAIKAFEQNSVSYLLKPLSEVDLQNALDKFRKLKGVDLSDLSKVLKYIKEPLKQYKTRFMLLMGKSQHPVSVEDIAYFMADDKYLFAYTKTGEKYFYDSTLTKLEEELNPYVFFRVNRKFYVSFQSVKKLIPYSKSRIKIKLEPENVEDVIISALKAKEFKRWLEK